MNLYVWHIPLYLGDEDFDICVIRDGNRFEARALKEWRAVNGRVYSVEVESLGAFSHCLEIPAVERIVAEAKNDVCIGK